MNDRKIPFSYTGVDVYWRRRNGILVQQPTPHYGKDSVEPTTCELLQKVLHTIGCTSRDKEIKKGLKRVSFPYRGGNFIAYTWEDCVYVHLWNTYWTDVSMDSLDEVSMRKAINNANLKCSVTIFYTTDEENSKMAVHFKNVIPLMQSMERLEDYLQIELDKFLIAQRVLDEELQSVREEMKNGSSRINGYSASNRF